VAAAIAALSRGSAFSEIISAPFSPGTPNGAGFVLKTFVALIIWLPAFKIGA
jgi:hypothetical protein